MWPWMNRRLTEDAPGVRGSKNRIPPALGYINIHERYTNAV